MNRPFGDSYLGQCVGCALILAVLTAGVLAIVWVMNQ